MKYLQNNLTLTFVWLIHNYELKLVDLKFRVLPTIGTTVATGPDDWKEFSISFREDSNGYLATIGKSRDKIWTLILSQWTLYQTYLSALVVYNAEYSQYLIDYTAWELAVQIDSSLIAPTLPTPVVRSHVTELTELFDYIDSIGVK
jgi:hypothetical protein